MKLTPQTYGIKNLEFLLNEKIVPAQYVDGYVQVVEEICRASSQEFERLEYIRIHGDCHLANILWGKDGPFLVDFDDMLCGPPVQDIWLLLPGRDEEAKRQLEVLLYAYESMRNFDRRSLDLIETLRALRMIHFSAWIGKRWQDPAFKRAFPDYGTERYWQEQLSSLREQLSYND